MGRDDTDGFIERILANHRADLLATATRLTGSRADAEDLLQDAVIRAWLFREKFTPGTNERAWMHRIVVNTFINRYRRSRREREVLSRFCSETRRDLASEATRAPSVAPVHELGDEVQGALEHMPDAFRTVLLRVDVADHSYREVADALGCPIGTVMSRLHRARRSLERSLRAYARAEGYREAA